ncbi:hypothetical protein K474DRAFT_1438433 [Panus rudis PR-1116 ss-1]|nr:hypothetical protein K474DRAFT_1438433 [Panus rudis PR-1116 ss-1]
MRLSPFLVCSILSIARSTALAVPLSGYPGDLKLSDAGSSDRSFEARGVPVEFIPPSDPSGVRNTLENNEDSPLVRRGNPPGQSHSGLPPANSYLFSPNPPAPQNPPPSSGRPQYAPQTQKSSVPHPDMARIYATPGTTPRMIPPRPYPKPDINKIYRPATTQNMTPYGNPWPPPGPHEAFQPSDDGPGVYDVPVIPPKNTGYSSMGTSQPQLNQWYGGRD